MSAHIEGIENNSWADCLIIYFVNLDQSNGIVLFLFA